MTNSNSPIKTGLPGARGTKKYWEYSSEGRPLSILLCWLMAKNNAVNKYANFYLDKGFDVMTVRISPAQLLWPTLSNSIVEKELMPILRDSDHKTSLVHGFSVGGYVFGQMLRLANENPKEYGPIMNTMIGQIWDSVVDINGTAIGVSKSVFPKSKFLQKSLENYINFHMNLLHNVATKHYFVSHEHFYNKPLKAPALFLCSEKDQISTMDVIQAVQDIWTKDNGIKCSTKLWENTPHVGHMQRHPDEYKAIVTEFLKDIGMRPPTQSRLLDSEKDKRNIYEPDMGTVVA